MSISSLSSSLLATLFKKADADESGTLTAQELDSVATDLGKATGKTATGEQLAKAYDTDRDGAVTAQEFEQGASLDADVHTALLKAQEIMSGATLIGYLNGDDDSSNSLAGLFGNSGNAANPLLAPADDSTDTPDDSLSALFEQLMANYNEGAQSITDQQTPTGDDTAAVTDPTKTESAS